MKLPTLVKRLLSGLTALTTLAMTGAAFGQGITTSGLNGFVTDNTGKPVAGATVTVIHEPTATTAVTTSRANGQYNISGLRVGGPYTVSVGAPSLQTDTRREIELGLGDAAVLNFALTADIVTLEKFTVAGERDVTFGAGKIGTGTSYSESDIAQVATVRRDIQDIAAMDSRFFLGSLDQGGQLSAQGQNFRFNSLLIDGVQAVDTFGLASNGFSSLRSPIPLDAVQSVSFELSPYDVRRAGFTGALMNVVTRSGTNTFHGSISYEETDQDWRAKNPVNGRRETFEERTWSYTLNGPIIRDKLFFALTYEDFERVSAPPAGNFIPDPTVLAGILARASALGYTAGNLSADNTAFQKTTIGKVDWNVFQGHRLSATYRKNEGQNTTFAQYTGTTTTSLSDFWYANPRLVDSYNAQLNSQWTPDFRTEVVASYTETDGSPKPGGSPFPQVQVQGVSGRRLDTGGTVNGVVFFGTDSSRQLNFITTKEKQFKFSGEYSLGDHTLTGGVEKIQTKYTNAFVQFTNGNYTFASPTTWQAGTPPSFYQLALPYPGFTIDDAIARWQYNAYSVFLQDTWHPNQALTILAGLRLDYPDVPEAPPVAAGFANAGFARDNGEAVRANNTTNSGNYTIAPRLGFIYNPKGFDRKTQIRGGLGLFQGKSPAVWISNAYSNAGATASLQASAAQLPTITFQANPRNQPVPTGTLPTPAININDGDLVQPALWKSNLAFDHKLPFGDITFTAEVYYNKVHKALQTEFLNYAAPATGPGLAPDGRRRYNGTVANSTGPSITGRRRVATFADVYLLTNTDKGEARGMTISLSRPMKQNWAWSASWTHGKSTEVSPMTSSVAGSNYSNRASFNPNEDVASISNTDIKDRIVVALTRRFHFIAKAPTTATLIYQARTGHPYSWVFRGDANGDGFAFNDLLYVPTGPTDPRVTWADTAQRDAFFAFVESSTLRKYKGGNPGRNSETAPWNQTLDLKVTQEIPLFKRVRAEVFANLLNLGNLINDSWGLLEEVPFSYRRAVAAASSYNAAGNGGQGSWAYTYSTATNPTLDPVPTVANDFPVSRWQVQAGVRVKF